MGKTGVVRPMRLWQSLLFFLVPGLYALFSQYILIPYLVRLGISEEYAYNTALLTVFVLLFFATIIALGVEGWSFNWATVRERLRVRRMDSNAWKWTLSFLVLYLLLGFLLNMLAQFVYERLGFRPPDADIPLTNIPFLAIVLVANVFSEELWWRGYILPPSGIGTWQIRLHCEWYSLVTISYVQVVGSALYASQTVDAAIRCSTHKEHYSWHIDSPYF